MAATTSRCTIHLNKILKKTQLDLNFLHSCKYHGVIPKFLNFKLANSRLRSSMMYTKCRRRLRSVELAQKKKHLQKLQEKHLAFLQSLRSHFSWFDFNHLIAFASVSNVESLKRAEAVQNRKFCVLQCFTVPFMVPNSSNFHSQLFGCKNP